MTAASASAPALERRREQRIPVRIPVVIRGTDGSGSSFEENTFSEDLCRGGAAISTRHPLVLGNQLEIHIPALRTTAELETEFSTQGRVVHVHRESGKEETIVGIEFTGPRFNRTFLPGETK
jgi:hypothetical protein